MNHRVSIDNDLLRDLDFEPDPIAGLLSDTVAAHRAANAALAASITAAAHFYDTRINDIDPSTIPARLDVERITHTSAIAEIAAATTRPAGTVETHLNIWWGSRPVYREMFTAGTISLEVLRTIRDHTLGAPATVIAALEPDIITATRHFTPTRLGKEIDAMITALDPEFDTRARRRAASTTKKVRVSHLPRGMARMSAVLGAHDAAELTALLDTECTRVCGLDPRPLDTRRADAFTALLRGGHLTCLCTHPHCEAQHPYTDTDTDENTGEQNTDDTPSNPAGDSNDPDGGSAPDESSAPDEGSGPDEGRGSGGESGSGSRSGAGHCPCGRALPPQPTSSVPDSTRHPHGATVTASRPLIHITADLETILGLHNRNAYLHGYGPLDPTTLRTLARDATWQIIFTTSRRYLDTLTDLTDPDPPPNPSTPPPSGSTAHTPQCTCTCGTPPRPHTDPHHTPDPFADLLAAAAAEHDRHTAHLPTRMSTPTRTQTTDDRRRATLTTTDNKDDPKPDDPNPDTETEGTDTGNNGFLYDTDLLADLTEPEPASTTPDLILGRTRTLAAGHLPDPPPNPPRAPAPAATAAGLADYYRAVVAGDPHHDHAEHPDGHGGHPTPPPGALTYTPGTALATYIRAQYPTCRHPGCTIASNRCDLDHIVEFDHHNPHRGGWTIAANLAPYCRTHHNLKTSKLWTTEKLPYDVIHTTDPHGNHYFDPPEL